MKIRFIGATHEVTGSCTLLEVNERGLPHRSAPCVKNGKIEKELSV